MLQVLGSAWALLLGVLLLMVGNGIQGTLLGIRGGLEGFSTFSMSIVMSAYFVGFLGGSQLAPEMIRRVGHVRVFAALGSLISAVLILYPTFAHPVAWTIGRVLIGFCFSGVYVTAESWLNDAASNENRGKALSLYMIVQMAGIVAGQFLLIVGDPSGFVLFVIPSVLVSIAFAPILLSISPVPAFETTKRKKLQELFRISPLGCVGMLILGTIYSALFGMSAVFGTNVGMSVVEISFFVAAIYLGGLLIQYPVGWVSDRMDRRRLIFIVSAVGGVAAAFAAVSQAYVWLLVATFAFGGATNPLYALLVAYTNDFLEHDEMAAASGGLILLSGLGAIGGPIVTGWMMGIFGPPGYFIFLAMLMIALAVYSAYRMTVRPAPSVEDTGSYAPILPSATAVAMEVAQEVFIENVLEDETNETSEQQDEQKG